MKTKQNIRLAVVIAATFLLTGSALAQPGWGRGRRPAGPAYGGPQGSFRGPRAARGGPGQRGMPGLMMLRRLDLTAEQRDKTRDIVTETCEQAQAARDTVVEEHQALEEAVAQGADRDEIAGSVEKLAQAIAKEAVLRAEAHARVKELLTEAQLAELEQMKARAERFRERRPGPQNRRGFASRQGGFWGPRWQRGPQMGPGSRRGPAWRSDNRAAARRRGPVAEDQARPFDREGRARRSRGASRGQAWRQGDAPQARETDRPSPRDRRFGEPSGARQRGPASQQRPGRRGRLPLQRVFKQADANGDGLLSMEELERFQNERKGEPPVQPR